MSLATPKLSLCMIVRDEEVYLDNCLKSISPYCDEIIIVDTGSKDKTKEIAKRYTDKIFDFKWIKDFSAARNFSFSKATGDWILWLDGDDVVKGAEKIKPFLEKVRSDIDAIMAVYEYDYDKFGNPAVVHWKERLIRNNNSFEWRKKIHENLAPKAGANVGKTKEFVVSHQHATERRDRSTTRNLEMLLEVLKEESQGGKKDPDPRTLFYLGNCFLDIGQWEDAIGMYTRYIKLSGWDEERCQAYYRLSYCYRQVKDYDHAVNAGFLALKERPDFPDGYFALAETYYHQENWEKTVLWAKKGLNQPLPSTTVVVNELEYKFRPLVYLADSLFNQGRFEEAKTTYEKALEYAPNTPYLEESLQKVLKLIKQKGVVEAFGKIVNYAIEKKEPFRIAPLLNAVTTDLADNPVVTHVRKTFLPPRTAKENEVTIFCGQSWEEWTPESVSSGIGGSEEAVIYLSKELVNLGYKVTVYATPGAKFGDYDGVRYLNYWEFSEKDNFNIFIAWRNPEIFSVPLNAKKKYVWLHDVPNPFSFTKERLKRIDKIIVLSQAHRNYLPDIEDSKFLVSSNGINTKDFRVKGTNNPHRLIYTSSYDRGLEHLLKMWPEIKKQVPQAELHVFYGWNTFDAIHRDNPERMAWKARMIELLNQVGITEHGRVGHKDLVREFGKSGIFAYPSHFEEISCISAMKAQAMGAIPVVTSIAALKETVQHGVKVEGNIFTESVKKQYLENLVSLLKDPKKQEEIRKVMVPWAKQTFSWNQVAKQWQKDFETASQLPPG